MAPITSLSTVSGRDLPDGSASYVAFGVVWLRGEHDLSTVPELSAALTQAITLDDFDVVVDLADVEFVDASIVGVFLRARELLRARSRCLVFRSPPLCVRRVLELCDNEDLLAAAEATPGTGTAGALGTFVPVPATDRADQPTDAPNRRHGPLGAGQVPALVSSVVVGDRDDELTTAVAGRGAP